jgi:hypothetical protein
MTTVAPPLQIVFAMEPTFTLKHSSVSPSSSDSDTEDHVIPFTLSPLDECRGFGTKARNYALTVRTHSHHHGSHKKTTVKAKKSSGRSY